MTVYDKGLIKAMKKAYQDSGYYAAMTDNGLLIQTNSWGAEIVAEAVPNSIKSLIVLHNGSLPQMNTAVHIQKGECASAILETVVGTMDDLKKAFTATGGISIKPTRLTFDGMRVWQTTRDLKLRLVDESDHRVLSCERTDANLVCGAIFGRFLFGSVYVYPQMIIEEDRPLINHLAEMQWIPLDFLEE